MPKNFKFKNVTEIVPAIKMLEKMGAINPKAYNMGECFILHAIEEGRHHLTISTSYRLPTWHELKTARYTLIPNDVMVVMVLPPKEDYVNIQEYCYHLWETTDRQISKL